MAIFVKAGESFDVTAHCPVLAGYDLTGEPLFIALYPFLHGYFTCIKNGASHATFIISGRTESVHCFYVLVLRHDPVDSKPIAVPHGAMDPTGPVFWLNYWPKRDPSLPDDPRFMELGQRLEFPFKASDGSNLQVHIDKS